MKNKDFSGHKRAMLIAAIPALLLLLLSSRAHFVRPQQASPFQDSTVKEKAGPGNSGERRADAKVADSELAQRIEREIEQSEFAKARWGISVISMSDGTTLYQRNADRLFTPASNMKIYTTGVALDLLGADYRWRTSVFANTQPDAGGRIQGDLVLYGRGAPDLVSQSKDDNKGSIAKLAGDLYERGVRRVAGNVIGDESYFRGDALGDGWQWTDIQWYFGAEASALSINGNEIDVNLVPSAKAAEPPVVNVSDQQGYVTVHNRMVGGKSGVRTTIGVHRGLSDNNLHVWGEFAPGAKGFGARLSVHQPALWAAKLFLDALRTHGITVEGQALTRDSRVPPSQRFDPARAVELAFVTSQPLSEIVKETNKQSNNLYAELILRTLGRERGEIAAQPEAVGRERGDDEMGLAVIRIWLSRAGISTGSIALHDGSGLSRLNLVTPESTARLLLSLSKTASGQVFRQSLPISGRDGTLAGRLQTLGERVSAKTGSLTYDNSLSGYLATPEGKLFTFSILCNDQAGRGNSIKLIDQIASLLAAYPNAAAQNSQKSQ